jgi:hypothetical protein
MFYNIAEDKAVKESRPRSPPKKTENPFIQSYDYQIDTKQSEKNVKKSIKDRVSYTNQGWGVNESPRKNILKNKNTPVKKINKVLQIKKITKFGPTKANFVPADDSDDDFNWV